MNTWDKYYKTHTPKDIPWNGVSNVLFDEIWNNFSLPTKGKLLDIGCGRGDKSLYFSNKGFKAWGIDISPFAIKKANLHVKGSNPIFSVGDIADLQKNQSIKNVNFDVILDLGVSQFLIKSEKERYLDQLARHLKKNSTFYILQTFAKDNEKDELVGTEEWIKRIAQSPKEVSQIFNKYFELVGRKRLTSNKGKSDLYVMKAKIGLR